MNQLVAGAFIGLGLALVIVGVEIARVVHGTRPDNRYRYPL